MLSAKATFCSSRKTPKLDTCWKTEGPMDSQASIPLPRTQLLPRNLRREQRPHFLSPPSSRHGKDFQERYTEVSSGQKASTHLGRRSIKARGNQRRQEIDLSVYLWCPDSRVLGGCGGMGSVCAWLPGDPSGELWGVLCLCSITPWSYRAI